MHRLTKIVAAIAGVVMMIVCAAACTSEPSPQERESNRQQNSYSRLAGQEPAHTMKYSPTRKTINAWIDTWSKPGQLDYVYLQNANGDMTGYYILEGPPVSMCAALTPTYKFVDPPGDGDTQLYQVPAPSIDGVYYSGGQCNEYYGKDATSGAIVDFTIGMGNNVLQYTKPLPNHPNVEPLGPSTVDDVKHR